MGDAVVPAIDTMLLWERLQKPDQKYRQWVATIIRRLKLQAGKDFVISPTAKAKSGPGRPANLYLFTPKSALAAAAVSDCDPGRELLNALVDLADRVQLDPSSRAGGRLSDERSASCGFDRR